MIKKFLVSLTIAALAMLAGGCSSSTDSNVNANANANTGNSAATTMPGADNSDITTTTDSNGVKTETRTFRNNPRVSKVVVTTRDGKRTVKVYSPSGEEREVSETESQNWMESTGDNIADAAGWAKDKSTTAAEKTKEGAQTVADKTVDTSKTVADKTVDASKTVADKTVDTSKTVANKSKSGAKTVVDATKQGVKKTGNTIKKIIP